MRFDFSLHLLDTMWSGETLSLMCRSHLHIPLLPARQQLRKPRKRMRVRLMRVFGSVLALAVSHRAYLTSHAPRGSRKWLRCLSTTVSSHWSRSGAHNYETFHVPATLLAAPAGTAHKELWRRGSLCMGILTLLRSPLPARRIRVAAMARSRSKCRRGVWACSSVETGEDLRRCNGTEARA